MNHRNLNYFLYFKWNLFNNLDDLFYNYLYLFRYLMFYYLLFYDLYLSDLDPLYNYLYDLLDYLRNLHDRDDFLDYSIDGFVDSLDVIAYL
jgi:hypothetical protein